MLQSSDIFESDGIIFDLEDAVSSHDKDAARTLLFEYFQTLKQPESEIIVRINDETTAFHRMDLNILITNRVDSVMLPKATHKTLSSFVDRIERFETEHAIKKKANIIPIIESARGLIDIHEIAAHRRVTGLLLGAEDLSTDLMAKRTRTGEEILYARSLLVLSARAEGIDAIDTPFTDTRDERGLEADARRSKTIGMNAKAAIHPDQVHIINRVYSPSEIEIEFARKVIARHEKIEQGAFSIDGKMIDKPIIERAKKTLESARRWGLIE